MRMRKICAIGLFLSLFLIPLGSTARGEATLVSLQKGGKGDQTWAVFSFDERAIWVGVTSAGDHTLSIYFLGNAGDLEGSMLALDDNEMRSISIHQMSQEPAIFRADVVYEADIPVAVLKNNRFVVVAFNNEKFLDSRMAEYRDDVSVTPGSLVSMSPQYKSDQIVTSLQFDGTFDWTGFLKPAADRAVLVIRGAEPASSLEDLYPEAGDLSFIRVVSDGNGHIGCRADLQFTSAEPFSIVRKARSLIVQTSSTDQHMQVVEASPAEPVMTLSGDEDATESRSPDSDPFEDIPAGTTESATLSEVDEYDLQRASPTPVAGQTETRIDPDPNAAQAESYDDTPLWQDDQIPWSDLVSFGFTTTPIRDALRIVARGSNLNMVIADGVEGLVTMDLRGVTLKQAIDMIVHTHDCEYIVDEGIITVKPVSMVYTGGSLTKVYRLQYADAENVAKVVKKVASNDSLVQVFHPEFLNFDVAGKNRMMKREVAIQGIRRSSVLVVTDRPEKIRQIDRVIRELDRAPAQILIESKLVEMAPVHTSEVGINWDKTITAMIQWQDILPDGDATQYSLLNTAPDKGGNFQMGHLSASQYKAVLDFINEKTDSKLISNPRLLAMDNEESSISVGTTVPVPRIQRGLGGQGDMVTFEYKEVNIQLNVTPHVTMGNYITMYVNPVIEEITGWVQYLEHRAPITDKRTVNSIVTVKNGETVVIGGLIKNQRIKTIKKVWLLGSLPLLGRLFQHETFEDKQTDLMIFITPRIVYQG